MADTFITFLNGCSASYGNSGTTYLPTTGETMIPWDGSKYTGIKEAYIEISCYYDAGSSPPDVSGVTMQLYDVTNSNQLFAQHRGASTGYKLIRTTDMSNYLPSGAANIEIRFKKSTGDSVTLYGSRLVIIQEATTTPKTMVMIPIGAFSNTSSTSYVKLSGGFGNNFEKHFLWDEDNYATIDNVYYWACLKVTGGATAYAKLATPAEANSVGEISTASASYTGVKSSDISGSITDDVDYTTWLKTSTARTFVYVSKAFLIIELSPVTKYQGVQTINAIGHYSSGTTDTELPHYQAHYYDDWSGVTQTNNYEATMKYTGAISPSYTGLYDDSVKIETLGNSSATYVRDRGGTETIADDSVLGTSVYIKAGGDGSSYVGNCWLVQTVTDITAETASAVRINIGDAWKNYVGMKLNIGDVWKAIAGMKMVIDDGGKTWKTVF